MAVMKSRPPDFSLAYEVGPGGRQTGGVLFVKSILRDLLGEVACSSLPENLGRFSLILRARPPVDGSLRKILRDGSILQIPLLRGVLRGNKKKPESEGWMGGESRIGVPSRT